MHKYLNTNTSIINSSAIIAQLVKAMQNKDFTNAIKIIEDYPLCLNHLFFTHLHCAKKNANSYLVILMKILKQRPDILHIINEQVLYLITRNADEEILRFIILHKQLHPDLLRAINNNKCGPDILLCNLITGLCQQNFDLVAKIIRCNQKILEDLWVNTIQDNYVCYYVDLLTKLIEEYPEILYEVGYNAVSNISLYGNKKIISRILSGVYAKVFPRAILSKIAKNMNADEEIFLQLLSSKYMLDLDVFLIKSIAENLNITSKVIKKILALNDLDIDILTRIAANYSADIKDLRVILCKIPKVLPGNTYKIIDVLIGVSKNLNADDNIFLQILCGNYSAYVNTQLLLPIARHQHSSIKVLRHILSDRYLRFTKSDILIGICSNINADHELLLEILELVPHENQVSNQQLFYHNIWDHAPVRIVLLILKHKNCNKFIVRKILSPQYRHYINPMLLLAIIYNRNISLDILQQIVFGNYVEHIDAAVLINIATNRHANQLILNTILSRNFVQKSFSYISITDKMLLLFEYKATAQCIIKVLGEYSMEQLWSVDGRDNFFLPCISLSNNPGLFNALITDKVYEFVNSSVRHILENLPIKILLSGISQLILSFIRENDRHVLTQINNSLSDFFDQCYTLIPYDKFQDDLVIDILNKRKQILRFYCNEQQVRNTIIREENIKSKDLLELQMIQAMDKLRLR